MSYASVAANNAPPLSQQPHPDQALLNTRPLTKDFLDDKSKVNLPPSGRESQSGRTTYEAKVVDDDEDDETFPSSKSEKENKRLQEVKAEGIYLWNVARRHLLRPGIAGGLVGLINLGFLAGAGRAFYTQPHLRGNRTALSSTFLTAIALVTVEGYAAEKYQKSFRGQAEEEQGENFLYNHLYEQVFRPKVLGGLVGLLNTVIIGTVGYFSYSNWNRPSWDRRTVSTIAIGILTIWASEGLLIQKRCFDK
ncbi:hypothetical protein BDZ94DRAFT_1201089 [Collybia nuda]|uniref:Uncharacterized protein n=1 Tax=Collybia nuda TaxID=64659 RepID=A0A9P5XVL3_9AGAR|nr:hypothetical protein BDZ94DRAFT_1201089 [Collybia nuda]